MSWVFGGATTDRVDASTTATTFGGNSSHCFTAGWWKPTTLTATRRYWGIGANTFMAVDTTTSEVRTACDRATTDSIWVSSGAAIATGNWYFIATYTDIDPAGAQNSVLWIAKSSASLPVQVTISSSTAGSGNGAGSTATFSVGNGASGTSLSFQGNIGQAFQHRSGLAAGVGPFPVSRGAALSQDEIDFIYRLWVVPLFQGRMSEMWGLSSNSHSMQLVDLEATGAAPMDTVLQGVGHEAIYQVVNAASGVTWTEERQPGELIMAPWVSRPHLVRR